MGRLYIWSSVQDCKSKVNEARITNPHQPGKCDETAGADLQSVPARKTHVNIGSQSPRFASGKLLWTVAFFLPFSALPFAPLSELHGMLPAEFFG